MTTDAKMFSSEQVKNRKNIITRFFDFIGTAVGWGSAAGTASSPGKI